MRNNHSETFAAESILIISVDPFYGLVSEYFTTKREISMRQAGWIWKGGVADCKVRSEYLCEDSL